MIDGQTFFDQPVKNYMKAYYNIKIITIVQRYDYIKGCLLDYFYFKES